jgi:predicted HAD superfamily Cof-like phosphohydrolase
VTIDPCARDAPFDPFDDVLAFHQKLGVLIGERPSLPDDDVIALRLRLIDEETAELRSAIGQRDLVATADAIADLLYVVYGTAVSFGLDIRPIFAEVHRTNMAKEGGRTRADGKVLKPADWRPPDIAPLLAEMRLERQHRDD